jgi:hypothetical protein
MSNPDDPLTYELSYEDVIEILRIIDATPDGGRLQVQVNGLRLTVAKSTPPAVVATR